MRRRDVIKHLATSTAFSLATAPAYSNVGGNVRTFGAGSCTADTTAAYRKRTSLDLKLDFKAFGDGVHDDSDAVQCALRSQTLVLVPPGTYRLTRAMQMYPGSRLRGTNITETLKPTPAMFSNASVFHYDAPANARADFRSGTRIDAPHEEFANTVFICTNAITPNVDPQYYDEREGLAALHTITSVELSNLVIDGNNIAHYGLYCFRAAFGEFRNLVFTRTTHLGCWAGSLFNGMWSNVGAIDNRGGGIQIGGMPVNWSSGWHHVAIHNMNFTNLWAQDNGLTGASAPYSTNYNPASFLAGPYRNVDAKGIDKGFTGFGIALMLWRGNSVTQLSSELNTGPGLYISPMSGPNTFTSAYFEYNNSRQRGGKPRTDVQGAIMPRLEGIDVWFEQNPASWTPNKTHWDGGLKLTLRDFQITGFFGTGKMKTTCLDYDPVGWKANKCKAIATSVNSYFENRT